MSDTGPTTQEMEKAIGFDDAEFATDEPLAWKSQEGAGRGMPTKGEALEMKQLLEAIAEQERQAQALQEKADTEHAVVQGSTAAIQHAIEGVMGYPVQVKSTSLAERVFRHDGLVMDRPHDGEETVSPKREDDFFDSLLATGQITYEEFLAGACIISDTINEQGERVVKYALIQFEEAAIHSTEPADQDMATEATAPAQTVNQDTGANTPESSLPSLLELFNLFYQETSEYQEAISENPVALAHDAPNEQVAQSIPKESGLEQQINTAPPISPPLSPGEKKIFSPQTTYEAPRANTPALETNIKDQFVKNEKNTFRVMPEMMTYQDAGSHVEIAKVTRPDIQPHPEIKFQPEIIATANSQAVATVEKLIPLVGTVEISRDVTPSLPSAPSILWGEQTVSELVGEHMQTEITKGLERLMSQAEPTSLVITEIPAGETLLNGAIILESKGDAIYANLHLVPEPVIAVEVFPSLQIGQRDIKTTTFTESLPVLEGAVWLDNENHATRPEIAQAPPLRDASAELMEDRLASPLSTIGLSAPAQKGADSRPPIIKSDTPMQKRETQTGVEKDREKGFRVEAKQESVEQIMPPQKSSQESEEKKDPRRGNRAESFNGSVDIVGGEGKPLIVPLFRPIVTGRSTPAADVADSAQSAPLTGNTIRTLNNRAA